MLTELYSTLNRSLVMTVMTEISTKIFNIDSGFQIKGPGALCVWTSKSKKFFSCD